MKRIALAVVAATALAAAASANPPASCFDFDAWRAAVAAADVDAADNAVAAAQTACGCASDGDACLTPPGYSQMTSPTHLRETARRVTAWRAEALSACRPLPEASPAEVRAKRDCLRSRADAFAEGLSGEPFGRAMAQLPPAAIRSELDRLPEAPNANGGGKPTREIKDYSEEAQAIGRQICTLTTRLEAAADRLDHVKRRGPEGAEYKWQREQELNAEIKELSDALLSLKRKFQLLTGEKYDPFVFCGPPEENGK